MPMAGMMPGMMGGDINPGKMAAEGMKKLSKEQPVVGEIMKGIQGFAKDENMQKMAKDLIKGPM